jgi:hypothetical protein
VNLLPDKVSLRQGIVRANLFVCPSATQTDWQFPGRNADTFLFLNL